MKKCKLAAMAWLSVCIVLFTSCGNSAGVSAGSTSEVKSTAVSESTAEEKQPYEILREKEDETKQIAADEEQQVIELKDALNEFQFFYTEADGAGDVLMGMSPHCDEAAEKGKSCILPFLYLFGPSVDPVMMLGFNYITDEYMDMDTVEIDTDNYRYTRSILEGETQKTKVTINGGQTERLDEMAMHLVTEDDLDALVDIVESEEVELTFAKYNTAKPVFVECEMPEEDRQAITDVLNAYYLYLNASEKVRAKALADISYTEVES